VVITAALRGLLVGLLQEAGRFEDLASVAEQTVAELRRIEDGTSRRAREVFLTGFVNWQKLAHSAVEGEQVGTFLQPPGVDDFAERGVLEGLRRAPDLVSLDPAGANDTLVTLLRQELLRPNDPTLAAIRTWGGDRLSLAENVSCRLRPRAELATAGRLQLTEVQFTTTHVDSMFSKVPDPMVLVARLGELANMAEMAAETLVGCGAELRDVGLVDLGKALVGASVTGSAHPVQGNLEAFEREAAGDLVPAAALFEKAARDALRDVSSVGGIGRFQGASWMFAHAADLLLQAQPPRVGEAVRILESGRAQDLRAARAGGASAGTGASQPLVAIEREIARRNGRLRTLTALATQAPEETRMGVEQERRDLMREIARLEEQHQRIAVGLAHTEPSRYRAAALAPALDAGQISARLRPDETVAYYLLGRERAWVIVIDRASARAVPLTAVDGEGMPILAARLRAYAHSLKPVIEGQRGIRVSGTGAPDDNGLAGLRRELYDLLIAPIEGLVPPGQRLIIVPDGPLASIPWAELGAPGRPLVARNPIRLLPGAYLMESPTGEGRLSAASPLVLGDPDLAGPAAVHPAPLRGAAGEAWAPLPGTRQEVEVIAGLLSARPLTGGEADEGMVKARLPGATVAHFATHGRADPLRPAFSLLVLARPRPGSAEDGFLHAFEIEALRMRAQLVVLSACETGKGSPRGSEGVMALDRAFLIAGAGAVVSSLWQVADDATAALMSAFYQSLSRGRPADAALADAMGQVRAEPRWSDPRYWSAFRLVGWGLR
jgi:CHAT domain-containing protein